MGSSSSENKCTLETLEKEVIKIDEKLNCFDAQSKESFNVLLSNLEEIKESLINNNKDGKISDTDLLLLKKCSSEIKSKTSNIIKSHREVHMPLSKFGKVISKMFVDDTTHLGIHLSDENNDLDDSSQKENNNYLELVIIEHLLRFGKNSVALKIAENKNLNSNEIGYERFKYIEEIISSLNRGDLEPAKDWLEKNKGLLGKNARKFEYSLTKLEFLACVQKNHTNLPLILESTRKLVPFAADDPVDFEHLMGSLVFLGKSFDGTPFADLNLKWPVEGSFEAMDCSTSDEQMSVAVNSASGDSMTREAVSACYFPLAMTDDPFAMFDGDSKCNLNVLTKVAKIFHTMACRQLGLSHVDPLFTAFSAGCRVLPQLHSINLAIISLGKYGSQDLNTLPVAVELDPIAIRHNIFHCPVIKEVSSAPVRLFCGHAISRDAFESLATSERNKVKCPYCPVDTHKNQIQELMF